MDTIPKKNDVVYLVRDIQLDAFAPGFVLPAGTAGKILKVPRYYQAVGVWVEFPDYTGRFRTKDLRHASQN